MNRIDKMICAVSPRAGARRLQARIAIRAADNHLRAMHYDAASAGRRTSSLRASSADADAAASGRHRMAYVSRDMLRNNAWAVRARATVVGHAVGDGILPKITGVPEALRKEGLSLVETHLERTAIDAEGRCNLYALQQSAIGAMVSDGECLIVPRFRAAGPGQDLPLQLRVLEIDYLDSTRDTILQGQSGNVVANGIEYDQDGRRVAYWLFDEHPGTDAPKSGRWSRMSQRYDARLVVHLYRQDRPGQQRGVSWFAPVVLPMQDLADYSDAQIMRQKIAACFTAFRHGADTTADPKDDPVKKLSPGMIVDVGADEEMTFASPPEVSGFDEFTRTVLRQIAVGIGITYEALTGDLGQVNFSSARMGRMEMDRNISAWQRALIIPQLLDPIGDWFKLAWMLRDPSKARQIAQVKIEWTPPNRIIVDPAREIPALKEAVRAGFQTRRGVQRGFGIDPDRILQEQIEERKEATDNQLVFDSDPSLVSNSGVTQARPAGSEIPNDEESTDE